MRQVNLQLVMS